MTIVSFLAVLVGLAAAGVLFASRMRMLRAAAPEAWRAPEVQRYQPMLRLMQAEEFAFADGNRIARRKMEAQRRQILRGYLRCIARDYGQLLAGIRTVVVQSSTDRPDLVKLVIQSRLRFAWALCRIEMRLALHTIGFGSVDLSHLVRAVESLRTAHLSLLAPVRVVAA